MRLPVPVWVTLGLSLFVVGNEARHILDGRSKLEAAGLPGGAKAYDLAVTLDVAPEPFHMNRLQKWGTMTGVSERTVTLRNVSADAVADIAREPWIAGLRASGG